MATATFTWPIHGDLDREELSALGLDPNEVLDFSVCVNPYGPSPRVREAIAQTPLGRYPDRKATELRNALADWPGRECNPDQILVGNGVSELIWLTCLAFLKPLDRVLIPEPTYGEYARSAAMMGASVITLRARAEDGFHIAPDKMRQELCDCQPRMVFLCNPGNPTGNLIDPETIAEWAEEWPACLFVIDEAYMAFIDEPAGPARDFAAPLAGEAGSNVLVLRSMTKDFALAGLRLGFAVGSTEVIESLAQVQPPWSVNAMAQAAGLAALGDLAHLEKSLNLLRRAKSNLMRSLLELDLAPLPSATNFFLLRVGDGAAFRHSLLKKGILVRDCASFGLPEYVRIATRRPEENSRLLQALREVRR